jgi:hypothetical protein
MKKMKIFFGLLLMAALVCFVPTKADAKKVDYGIKKNYTISVGRKDIMVFKGYGRPTGYFSYKVVNKSIAKVVDEQYTYLDSKNQDKPYVCLVGKKVGKTKVNVYYKKKKIGSFTAKVVKAGAKIKSSKKVITLKYYNINGKSLDCSSSWASVDADRNLFLSHWSDDAKYILKSSNSKVARVETKIGSTNLTVLSKGTAKITVYEKIKKSQKKIGTFTIKTVAGKMADPINYRVNDFYDDGFFGHGEYYENLCLLNTKDNPNSLDMLAHIKKYLLPEYLPTDYTITYTASDPSIVTFKDGVMIGLKEGECKITYTMKFRDGSVATDHFNVGVTAKEI